MTNKSQTNDERCPLLEKVSSAGRKSVCTAVAVRRGSRMMAEEVRGSRVRAAVNGFRDDFQWEKIDSLIGVSQIVNIIPDRGMLLKLLQRKLEELSGNF